MVPTGCFWASGPRGESRTALGLRVAGTLGLLVRAKEKGLLPAVRPPLEALLRAGFYAKPSLIQRILRDAGEAEA